MTAIRWQLALVRCKYEPKIIPFLLAAVRLLVCLVPQTGYIHPDEFFQSSDISGGHYFESNIHPVWEFTGPYPIRCMLIQTTLNSIAFKLASLVQPSPSPYLLLVAPRLIYTLSSFIIDFCLYKLCQYYSSRGLWYLPVSIVFQTSFICLSCLTRTFSNVPEVIIFSILLVVVCQLIKPRFRILFVTPTRRTPTHERVKASTQLTSSMLIGFLITLGTFNRPTFPCFALVPALYWLNESFKRNSYNARLNIQRVLVPVAISSSLTAVLLSTYDTFYYTDAPTVKNLIDLLLQFKFAQFYELMRSTWVVTPYNFIRFNTNVDNLSKYGLHAPYTHMLVNIPFAFSLLGFMFYAKLINLMVGSGVIRLIFSTHRIHALMLLSVLTSTILLSFVPHQEFRFLLPLIVPLVYAFAYNIYASNHWMALWLVYNLALTYFYACIHQAGIMQASLDLAPTLKSYAQTDPLQNKTLVDVSAFRCYIVPTYHWNIARDDYRFKFHLQDTMDEFSGSVVDKLSASLKHRSNHADHAQKFFFLLHNLYLEPLRHYIQENYSSNLTEPRLIKQYAPHFGGEDLSFSVTHLREFGLRSWREAFGFVLVQSDLIINEAPG